jgi:chemotaxis protein MotB
VSFDAGGNAENAQKQNLIRNRVWMLTFVSLFTSLLAFFILIITITELEGVSAKRSYQKIMNQLYSQALQVQQKQGWQWMQIDNTLSKGVRVVLDPALFATTPLFAPARADINPRYYPYLHEVSQFLAALKLDQLEAGYQRWLSNIERAGFAVDVTITVEGHTDSIPLTAGARFRNNIELSTYRAYEVMQFLQADLNWSPRLFSIAGYGSFRPIVEEGDDPINRRIEIYIAPQMHAGGQLKTEWPP